MASRGGNYGRTGGSGRSSGTRGGSSSGNSGGSSRGGGGNRGEGRRNSPSAAGTNYGSREANNAIGNQSASSADSARSNNARNNDSSSKTNNGGSQQTQTSSQNQAQTSSQNQGATATNERRASAINSLSATTARRTGFSPLGDAQTYGQFGQTDEDGNSLTGDFGGKLTGYERAKQEYNEAYRAADQRNSTENMLSDVPVAGTMAKGVMKAGEMLNNERPNAAQLAGETSYRTATENDSFGDYARDGARVLGVPFAGTIDALLDHEKAVAANPDAFGGDYGSSLANVSQPTGSSNVVNGSLLQRPNVQSPVVDGVTNPSVQPSYQPNYNYGSHLSLLQRA